MTGCCGSLGGRGTRAGHTGRAGRGAHPWACRLMGVAHMQLSSTERNILLFQNNYPNLALFRNNCSAFISLPALIQNYLRARAASVVFSIYGSSQTDVTIHLSPSSGFPEREILADFHTQVCSADDKGTACVVKLRNMLSICQLQNPKFVLLRHSRNRPTSYGSCQRKNGYKVFCYIKKKTKYIH